RPSNPNGALIVGHAASRPMLVVPPAWTDCKAASSKSILRKLSPPTIDSGIADITWLATHQAAMPTMHAGIVAPKAVTTNEATAVATMYCATLCWIFSTDDLLITSIGTRPTTAGTMIQEP